MPHKFVRICCDCWQQAALSACDDKICLINGRMTVTSNHSMEPYVYEQCLNKGMAIKANHMAYGLQILLEKITNKAKIREI